MKHLFLVLYALIIGGLLLTSCNKPDTIGSDLLDGDQADVQFMDTITMVSSLHIEDSIQTFALLSQLDDYLVGELEDPIFGTHKSSLAMQFGVSDIDPQFLGVSSDTVIFDSLVLTLVYSDAFYGDSMALHTLNFHRLTEDLDASETYYSNHPFQYEAAPMATLSSFKPKPGDSVLVKVPTLGVDSSLLLRPHIRVKIEDPVFINELLTNQDLYESDTLFNDWFKGLFIETTDPSGSMMAFDLQSGLNRLNLYYSMDFPDTLQNKEFYYTVSLANPKVALFDNNNFVNSDVEAFVNDDSLCDSLLFIQGMAGPNIKLDFPYVDQLENIIINSAEIELVLNEDPAFEGETYPPIENLLISEMNEDGLLLIEDVIRAFEVNNLTAFGGALEEYIDPTSGATVRRYKMNISAHFQDMINGTAEKSLFISAFPKAQIANRSVLYGPGHSQFSARLNVVYTNL